MANLGSTKVDVALEAIKNHRISSVLVLLGVIVIGIAAFTNALSDLGSFLGFKRGAEQAEKTASTAKELQVDFLGEQETASSMVVAARARAFLRELTSLESGRKLSETPPGTFFFVRSIDVTETVRGGIHPWSVARFRRSEDDFEFHYLSSDQLNILGFVSEATLGEIGYLDGRSKHRVILFPVAVPQTTALIFLPLSRIINADVRYIEFDAHTTMPVLDCSIR